MRRFDGEDRWFLFRAEPLRNEAGEIVKWYGTNTDLEEKKRVEEALRISERNARLIVDSIPGQVVRLSASGEVEAANPQVLTYFGTGLEGIKELDYPRPRSPRGLASGNGDRSALLRNRRAVRNGDSGSAVR